MNVENIRGIAYKLNEIADGLEKDDILKGYVININLKSISNIEESCVKYETNYDRKSKLYFFDGLLVEKMKG